MVKHTPNQHDALSLKQNYKQAEALRREAAAKDEMIARLRVQVCFFLFLRCGVFQQPFHVMSC